MTKPIKPKPAMKYVGGEYDDPKPITKDELQSEIAIIVDCAQNMAVAATSGTGAPADYSRSHKEATEEIMQKVDEYVAAIIGEDEQPDTIRAAGVTAGKRQYEPGYSLRASVINERLTAQRKAAGLS